MNFIGHNKIILSNYCQLSKKILQFFNILRDRLMVGPLTLNQVILVRLQVPQPNINKSMLKIIGNDIVREGTKIGWISGNDIFDQGGNKIIAGDLTLPKIFSNLPASQSPKRLANR